MNIRNLKHCLSAIIVIVLAQLPLAPASGSTQVSSSSNSVHIRPFTATYDTTWYPLSLKGSASRTLKAKNSNHGLFIFEGKIMGATLNENSSLQWKGCSPLPRSFSRSKKYLFSNKIISQQTFNWPAKNVSTLHKDKAAKLTITNSTFDPLSYQLALRCDLKQGKTQLEYKVVRKTKIKKYRFEIIGEEEVSTPLGVLQAIKVKRSSDKKNKQTTLWFSKKHDFTLIKLEQKEENNNHYVFIINNLEIH